MIQTQILAVDNETRAQLLAISKEIERNKNNPEIFSKLIVQHDELMKRARLKRYDPREEACFS